MRRHLGSAMVALCVAGCDGGASAPDAAVDAPTDASLDAAVDAAVDATVWPPLLFDVQYGAGHVSLTASGPARSACKFYEFLRSGCEVISDLHTCFGGPLAPWITRASLLNGGTRLATASPVDVWRGVSFVTDHEDLTVVLEASDGQRAEIPLVDHVAPPSPMSTATTYDGTTLHLEWDATPTAASTLITVWGDIWGYRCHVAAPQHAIDIPWAGWSPTNSFVIQTFALAPPIATPLGEAKVWIGDAVSGLVPAPP